MKSWLDSLSERERYLVFAGAAFVIGFIIYSLIYSPLVHGIRDKQQQLQEKQQTLSWLQQMHEHYVAVKMPETMDKSTLLSIFADQLKSTSFHTFQYQLQQTGTGDIQLSFEKVPYNAFLAWLWGVRQNYAFTIEQFTAEKTDTEGVVKLSVVIEAKHLS